VARAPALGRTRDWVVMARHEPLREINTAKIDRAIVMDEFAT
jgi:hypothetical protein